MLLVTSSFWGGQHGSSDIITAYQDSGNDGIGIALTINRIRLGSTREFYCKKDKDNSRVWLYVYVTGGNGYGTWNTSIIQQSHTVWTTSMVENIALSENDKEVIPDYLALSTHAHECLTNADIDKMF